MPTALHNFHFPHYSPPNYCSPLNTKLWEVVEFPPIATTIRCHVPTIPLAVVPKGATGLHLAGAAWTSNTHISESVEYAPHGVTAGMVSRRRRMPVLAAFSILLAALTVGCVVFRCFSGLKSRKFENYNGMTTRRLAVFTGDSCDVYRC